MYSELWVQAPPATLEEASRRAVTAGVSSWGGELGSGSVPLPAMAALGSAGGRGRRTQSPPPLLSGSAAEVWTSTGMMEGVRCGSSRVWGKVWTYTCAEEVVHLTLQTYLCTTVEPLAVGIPIVHPGSNIVRVYNPCASVQP